LTITLYTKLSFDQHSDNQTLPQRKGKFQLHRILVTNGAVYLANLGACGLFGSPASTAGFKGLPSTCTISGQPIVYASTRETESFNDYFRTLAFLYPLNNSDTNFFHSLGTNLSSIKLFNERTYTSTEEKCLNNYALFSNLVHLLRISNGIQD